MRPCVFNPQQGMLSNGKEPMPSSRLNSHQGRYGVVDEMLLLRSQAALRSNPFGRLSLSFLYLKI